MHKTVTYSEDNNNARFYPNYYISHAHIIRLPSLLGFQQFPNREILAIFFLKKLF